MPKVPSEFSDIIFLREMYTCFISKTSYVNNYFDGILTMGGEKARVELRHIICRKILLKDA